MKYTVGSSGPDSDQVQFGIQEFYEPMKRDAMDELTSLWSTDVKRSGADNSADLYYDSYSSF